MKASPETLAALEFSVVRNLLAERAVTPMGRPLALALAPLSDPKSVTAGLDETDEAVRLLEEEGGLPLRGIGSILEVLERIGPEGAVLTGPEVLTAVTFCAVVEDVRSIRVRLGGRFPHLGARIERLPDLRAIVKAIHGKITPGGALEDTASPELARVRSRILSATAALRSRLEAILARGDSEKFLSDSFITERGGRFVIPVRSDAPVPVRGIVHGGSSSGATLFVEPLATVDLNNELVQLRDAEIAEVERILGEWTKLVRERLGDLELAATDLAHLDLAQAKGLLARDLAAVRPRLDDQAGITISQGRHPLLERTLAARGGRMVPIDLRIPPGTSTLIVSGPNAGGKTVVLKTTGLLALMAHAGLRVPAAEASFPVLRQVLVDIGDRQSIEGSLSTFSAHVQNLSEIASSLEPPCLVLIDEIGTGTDPVEGGALAIALLEWLRARGAITIATTHHGPVKVYGIETPGVSSASVEFDETTLAPTYRLLSGIAGASSGLEIAERLGLDPAIVADARGRIGPAGREGEGYLHRLRDMVAALEEDRRELERLRDRLEADARRAREEAIRSDHERAERFRGELSEALQEFRSRAREHLEGLADKKEALRLEKERARREAELRREFERIDRAAAPTEPRPGRARGGRSGVAGDRAPRGTEAGARGGGGFAEVGSRTEAGTATGPGRTGLDEGSRPGDGTAPFAPGPGDFVRVEPYGRQGRIESVEGGLATVLIGSARFRVPYEDCRPPDGEGAVEVPRWKAPPAAPRSRELGKESVPGEINLIGFTVEEAIERLDKFLDDASIAGHRSVRVVHGHGTGRLKSALRRMLSSHTHAASHRPGEPNEGGDGATIVVLEE